MFRIFVWLCMLMFGQLAPLVWGSSYLHQTRPTNNKQDNKTRKQTKYYIDVHFNRRIGRFRQAYFRSTGSGTRFVEFFMIFHVGDHRQSDVGIGQSRRGWSSLTFLPLLVNRIQFHDAIDLDVFLGGWAAGGRSTSMRIVHGG